MMMLLVALLLLYGSVCMVTADLPSKVIKTPVEEPKKENATITPWQYCFGCRETVNLYMQITVKELLAMQKSGKPPTATLDGASITNMICDDPHFQQFQPFAKYSCIKIMNDGYQQFLNEFTGATSANGMAVKADNFKRKRRICVKHLKACKAEEFKKANVTLKARTKCAACRIVGQEIELYKKSLAKKKSFSAFLEDGNFCSNLGYNYQPYQWVETTCDEMIDEHLDDIAEILRFNAQVAATGMNPTETATDMMCKEFYKCKKDNEAGSVQEAGDEDEL